MFLQLENLLSWLSHGSRVFRNGEEMIHDHYAASRPPAPYAPANDTGGGSPAGRNPAKQKYRRRNAAFAKAAALKPAVKKPPTLEDEIAALRRIGQNNGP